MAMISGTRFQLVDDGALVGRIRAGDREAWSEVYRRYADRVYTLCWSVLRTDEAADATQEAFLLALQHLKSLRDPAALRPWLLRIAWTEAVARAKKRAKSIPADALSIDVASAEPGPEDLAQQHELQRLVWAAAAGLPQEDRVVLELNVHQGLAGDELARAIGVSPGYARTLVQRVRARTDRALGALLVATKGQRDCATLKAVLAGWDGRFTPLIRERVARHIDECRVCTDRRTTMASPVTLLGSVPILAVPAWVTDKVLAAATPAAPAAAATGSSLHLAQLGTPRGRIGAALGAGAAAAMVITAVLVWPTQAPAGPFTVAGPGDDHSDVQLAVDGDGRAFVAWTDLHVAEQGGSMVRNQTDDGWTEPVNLSAGFHNPGRPMLLARPDGKMCVYFHGFAEGTEWLETWGLYERCWNGDSWTGPTQLTRVDSKLFYFTTRWVPAFASNGTLHTAFETPPETIGVDGLVVSAPGINGFPQFIGDRGGRLHVFWYAPNAGGMVHRWSGDDGHTWSEPVRLGDYGAWAAASDGQGGVYVIASLGGDIPTRRWTVDAGWGAPVNANGGERNLMTYLGLAALDDGGAAVAWARDRTELVVSERHDGETFAAGTTVAETAGVPVSAAQLAADGKHVHLVWLAEDGTIVHLRLR
jgi:RNA polymerase sigma factor (sigma-70 family)